MVAFFGLGTGTVSGRDRALSMSLLLREVVGAGCCETAAGAQTSERTNAETAADFWIRFAQRIFEVLGRICEFVQGRRFTDKALSGDTPTRSKNVQRPEGHEGVVIIDDGVSTVFAGAQAQRKTTLRAKAACRRPCGTAQATVTH